MNQAVCTSLGIEAVHEPLLICSAHIRGKTLSMLNFILLTHAAHRNTQHTPLPCTVAYGYASSILPPFSPLLSFFLPPALLPTLVIPPSSSSPSALLPPSYAYSSFLFLPLFVPLSLLFLHCPFLSPFSSSPKCWY